MRSFFLVYGAVFVVGGLTVLAAADAVTRGTGTVGLAALLVAMILERRHRGCRR
jgi:hypothetical protein